MCSPVRDQPSFLLCDILNRIGTPQRQDRPLQTRLFRDCGIGCLSWDFSLHSGGTPNIALERDATSPPPQVFSLEVWSWLPSALLVLSRSVAKGFLSEGTRKGVGDGSSRASVTPNRALKDSPPLLEPPWAWGVHVGKAATELRLDTKQRLVTQAGCVTFV